MTGRAEHGHRKPAMLLKWISCDVTDAAVFDVDQRRWAAALRGIPGFLAQGGGWSRRLPNAAHVFAFWDSERSHARFMAHEHDEIVASHRESWAGITVRTFLHRFDIGRPARPTFSDATVLRVAHCRVHPDRVEHFVAAQAGVWNPGMGACAGLRRGVFAQAGESTFLVLSMWRSVADHESYLDGPFAELRARAGVASDLAEMSGHLVDIEPAWSVSVPPAATSAP